MDDPRIGQDPMNQPRKQEVGGHLVDDPAMLQRKRANSLEILRTKRRFLLHRELRRRCRIQSGSVNRHLQRGHLTRTEDVRMRREDLFDERSARSGHANDEHR